MRNRNTGSFVKTTGIPIPGTPWRACRNEKGYLRFVNGPHRKKYVHRWLMEEMVGGPIPEGMCVHHADHRRTHNCPSNLQLLDKRIHDAISVSRRLFLLANPSTVAAWLEKEERERAAETTPDWVLGYDSPPDCAGEPEIE